MTTIEEIHAHGTPEQREKVSEIRSELHSLMADIDRSLQWHAECRKRDAEWQRKWDERVEAGEKGDAAFAELMAHLKVIRSLDNPDPAMTQKTADLEAKHHDCDRQTRALYALLEKEMAHDAKHNC